MTTPTDRRVKLKKQFQQDIFTKAIDTYSSQKLSNFLDISRGMIYHYRNYRVDNIPSQMLQILQDLLNLDDTDIKANTLTTYSHEEKVTEILDAGRQKRKQDLKRHRDNIPPVTELVDKQVLHLDRWFAAYRKLIDFGCRNITNVERIGNRLKLTYTAYTKSKKKTFQTTLPRTISVDQDFLYFLGLWLGDKVGGGRIGVSNKNIVINEETDSILRTYYQEPIWNLYIGTEKPLPDRKYDIVTRINADCNGYAVGVYSVNSIFKRFFEHIEANINSFLNAIENKHLVFAGLFDAEGNIFLEDGCFRWSCKDKALIPTYEHHLKELDLFRRYDGANFVGYNLHKFNQLIYPTMKHPEKTELFNLLYHKQGNLPRRYKLILEAVYEHEGETRANLAKALKKVKVSSQLRFLEDHDYVVSDGYPKKTYITKKGLANLVKGERT